VTAFQNHPERIKTQGWFLIGLSLPVCASTDFADGDRFSFKLTMNFQREK
jgi:hypothetical protein